MILLAFIVEFWGYGWDGNDQVHSWLAGKEARRKVVTVARRCAGKSVERSGEDHRVHWKNLDARVGKASEREPGTPGNGVEGVAGSHVPRIKHPGRWPSTAGIADSSGGVLGKSTSDGCVALEGVQQEWLRKEHRKRDITAPR